MSKPNVLYAIQGTGNGHVSRACTLLPYFEQAWNVDLLISGNQVQVTLPKNPKIHLHGLVLRYNSKGGISYWKTIRSFNPFRFFRELIQLPIKEYDFVINDFECVSAWACRLRGVAIIGLSHQAAVLMPGVPKPPKSDVLGKWILKYYAPTKQAIGFHFQTWHPQIAPPIIKKSLRRDDVVDAGFYLVYLPAFSRPVLKEFLNAFPNVRFVVFDKTTKAIELDQNIEWQPISNDMFNMCLMHATGVVTSAGFETPAETLYLQKKLLVIPIQGQYEQYCNAAALKSLWVPAMETLDPDTFSQWLESGAPEIDMNACEPEVLVTKVEGLISADFGTIGPMR
jgi:uncharacterized protein (TIGR00661 family)